MISSSVSVFACLSKACAPPPVGKGGSLSSKGGRPPSSGSSKDAKRVQSMFDSDRSASDLKVEANKAVSDRLAKDPAFLKLVEKESPALAFAMTVGLTRRPEDKEPQNVAAVVARDVIDAWAENATINLSSLSQLGAAAFHGVSKKNYVSWLRRELDPILYTSTLNADESTLYKAVIRAEYEATQAWFKERGITSLVVHRGLVDVNSDGTFKPGDVVNVDSNPLSSWTVREDTAKDFGMLIVPNSGGLVLSMEVPVEMIQATPFTGRGCYREREVVLIGYPSVATVAYVADSN